MYSSVLGVDLEQMNLLLIVSMNFLHLERVICIISYSCRLCETPTPRTYEFVTHSLYELPAHTTGDMHHLLLMSSL
jgi:hypothetical protein